jgi:hypothetical protein
LKSEIQFSSVDVLFGFFMQERKSINKHKVRIGFILKD